MKALMSHPSRVRGLKLYILRQWRQYNKSHPSRVRGLKQKSESKTSLARVAPITGAWIETIPSPSTFKAFRVAPITGAWIETRKD